jgi:multicomponent Na+:H+ antiporter subunit F
MIPFVAVLTILVVVAMVVTLGAVLRYPVVFDRIVGIGMVGTKTTVLLAFVGIFYDRLDAFVDIALTYALLNFIVTLAVAKYFAVPHPEVEGEKFE